jgi:hypothetical protein
MMARCRWVGGVGVGEGEGEGARARPFSGITAGEEWGALKIYAVGRARVKSARVRTRARLSREYFREWLALIDISQLTDDLGW